MSERDAVHIVPEDPGVGLGAPAPNEIEVLRQAEEAQGTMLVRRADGSVDVTITDGVVSSIVPSEPAAPLDLRNIPASDAEALEVLRRCAEKNFRGPDPNTCVRCGTVDARDERGWCTVCCDEEDAGDVEILLRHLDGSERVARVPFASAGEIYREPVPIAPALAFAPLPSEGQPSPAVTTSIRGFRRRYGVRDSAWRAVYDELPERGIVEYRPIRPVDSYVNPSLAEAGMRAMMGERERRRGVTTYRTNAIEAMERWLDQHGYMAASEPPVYDIPEEHRPRAIASVIQLWAADTKREREAEARRKAGIPEPREPRRVPNLEEMAARAVRQPVQEDGYIALPSVLLITADGRRTVMGVTRLASELVVPCASGALRVFARSDRYEDGLPVYEEVRS